MKREVKFKEIELEKGRVGILTKAPNMPIANPKNAIKDEFKFRSLIKKTYSYGQ
ncbi:MAG: hypothetical protein V4635_02195 [Bacteroidota bacterium]